MGFVRVLRWCAVVSGVLLLLSAAPASAKKFVPEGAEVKGTGEEAKFFSNQIDCKKNKFTGKVKKTIFVSKVEGTMEYEECKYGLRAVEDFSSVNFAIEATERVSFRETVMKVEKGLCTITITAAGENLMLSSVLLANEGLLRVKATINVPGTGTGIIYKTSGTECGILKEKEGKPATYTSAETLDGTNIE
jgi:hypothetical protein